MARVLLELSDKRRDELEALAERLGLDDIKALFNNSLTLFEWAIEQTENGCNICSVNEVARTRLGVSLPCLDKLQQKLINHKPEPPPVKGAHLKVVK